MVRIVKKNNFFLDEIRLNPPGRARAATIPANLLVTLETTPALSATDLRAVLPGSLTLVASSFPNVILSAASFTPPVFQLTTTHMDSLDPQPVSQMRRNIDFDLVQKDTNGADIQRFTISRPFIIYSMIDDKFIYLPTV